MAHLKNSRYNGYGYMVPNFGKKPKHAKMTPYNRAKSKSW